MEAVTHDVTDAHGTKGLEAIFQVEVPPDPLLDILWSPANFGRLFPDIEDARVVREDEATTDVAYRIDAVVRPIKYVLSRALDRKARTITWREIGGDLRRVRGGWRVEPSPGPSASRVTYSAFVDVGFFVPTGLVRNAAKRKLGEMVERIQRVAVEIYAARGAR
jgi:carbon monoxide dehydrogenase subunit G